MDLTHSEPENWKARRRISARRWFGHDRSSDRQTSDDNDCLSSRMAILRSARCADAFPLGVVGSTRRVAPGIWSLGFHCQKRPVRQPSGRTESRDAQGLRCPAIQSERVYSQRCSGVCAIGCSRRGSDWRRGRSAGGAKEGRNRSCRQEVWGAIGLAENENVQVLDFCVLSAGLES
jgi:hypothetical protein